MWAPTSAGSAVAPRNFKLTIGKYAPQFSGYNQNDSQELLGKKKRSHSHNIPKPSFSTASTKTSTGNFFHTEFVKKNFYPPNFARITKKQFIEMKDEPNKSDEELASIFWQSHLKRDQSIIVDLFQGQLKSRIVKINK